MAFALAVPAVCQAQDPGSAAVVPAVGSRVRVVFGSERLTGALVASGPTTTTIAVDGRVRAIPRASITAMQVSVGRRGRAGGGALLGAVGGLLIGLTSPTDEPGNCLGTGSCDRGQVVVGAMLATTLLGAGIGALLRTDRWVDARFDAGLVAPVGTRGLGLAARVRW